MYYTLTNAFHGTEVRLRVHPDNSGIAELTPAQVRRARATLCGIRGCTCGDVCGARPQQCDEIDRDRIAIYIPEEEWV